MHRPWRLGARICTSPFGADHYPRFSLQPWPYHVSAGHLTPLDIRGNRPHCATDGEKETLFYYDRIPVPTPTGILLGALNSSRVRWPRQLCRQSLSRDKPAQRGRVRPASQMLRRTARDAQLKHDSPQRAASHLERKKSLTRIASSEKSVMRRREDLSLPRSERGPLPLSPRTLEQARCRS